jgi:PBP1b-binding outer membrane lipoprotein LpoB
MKRMLSLTIAALFLAACSPEVGSPSWCEKMKAKPKGEWTVDEIGEYGKSCLLR